VKLKKKENKMKLNKRIRKVKIYPRNNKMKAKIKKEETKKRNDNILFIAFLLNINFMKNVTINIVKYTNLNHFLDKGPLHKP